MNKITLSILLLTLLAACSVPPRVEQEYTKADKGYTAMCQTLHSEILKQLHQGQGQAFAIALIDTNAVVWTQYYGYKDSTKRIPLDENSLFCLGSISKIFTGIAIMQLLENHRLSLDDPISKYIPELSLKSWGSDTNPAHSITIRMLLTHHSGIPSDKLFGGYSGGPYAFRTVTDFLSGRYVQFPAGEFYSYCNNGFALLGIIIEKASGEDYYSYTQNHIFKPLGMTRTSFLMDEAHITNLVVSRVAVFSFREPSVFDSPAGSLLSTPADMSRFIRCILNKGSLDGARILKQETLEQMTQPQPSSPLDFGFQTGLAWELGWPNFPYQGPIIQHGGAVTTFFSMLGIIPELGIGVITMVNGYKCGSLPYTIADKSLHQLLQHHGSRNNIPPVTGAKTEFIPAPVPSRFDLPDAWAEISSNGNGLLLTIKRDKQTQYKMIRRKGGLYSLRNVNSKSLQPIMVGFYRDGDRVYMVNKQNVYTYPVGTQQLNYSLSEDWKNWTGEYRQIDKEFVEDDPVFTRFLNSQAFKVKVIQKEDRLYLSIGPRGTQPNTYVLLPRGDGIAIGGGLGYRYSGTSIFFRQEGSIKTLEILGMKFTKIR